jgi:surface antigen
MALLLASPFLLAGCSMSIMDGDAAPETTASIGPPVSVQQPLPSTLAFSDATRIGEAATSVLAQAQGNSTKEWINASTGSSGTLETETADVSASANCRQFSTVVTSIGGVHHYSGAICQQHDGPAIVQLDEGGRGERS